MAGGYERLEAAIAALDERAMAEPGLERYRLAPQPDALAQVPDGWFLSRSMERLLRDGGWWPGYVRFGDDHGAIADILIDGMPRELEDRVTIRWLFVGSVWEKDGFWTPVAREPFDSAPLLGFSWQALWISMVFPHEAALLEAFTVTYDELGLLGEDEGFPEGSVDPMFVEWLTPPYGQPDEREQGVRDRLAVLSWEWSTDHPCWNSDFMPVMSDEPWPNAINEQVLGLAPGDLEV